MKTLFKRLDTRGHFRDIWHRASSRRNDKKISTRRERRLLKREAPYWIVDYEHQDFTCTGCRCHSEKAYLYCPWCGSEMDWKDGQ